MVCGFEADACWPGNRLVIELDSYDYHGGRMYFERDARRDYQLKCAGYSVIRLTHHMILEEAEIVARLIKRELERPEIAKIGCT